MNRRFWAVLACCWSLLNLGAEGIEVSPVAEQPLQSEPRAVLTVVVRVLNASDVEQELLPRVTLPEGWRLVLADAPFTLAPRQKGVRLLSIQVPQEARAGDYQVLYQVERRGDPSVGGRCALTVTVLPQPGLRVQHMQSPDYVLAGGVYMASFVIVNTGNVGGRVVLSIQGQEGFASTLQGPEVIHLKSAEARTVTVEVRTSAKQGQVTRHILHLNARLLDEQAGSADTVSGQAVRAEAVSAVDVIPTRLRARRFHTLPARLTLDSVFDHQEDSRVAAQAELSGGGTLDERGDIHLSFLIRPPGPASDPALVDTDAYAVDFRTRSFGAALGDRSYQLTPLTQSSRYGRGLEAWAERGPLGAGGYYLQDRFDPNHPQQAAAYLDYVFASEDDLGLNYLHRWEGSPADLLSFESRFRLSDAVQIGLESAVGREGEPGYAYLADLQGRQSSLSYFVKYIHASPDFPGSYRDFDLFSGRIEAPLAAGLSLSASVSQEKHNLELDPALFTASLTQLYLLGLDWQVRRDTRLYLDCEKTVRRDMISFLPDYGSQQDTVRFAVGQSRGTLNLWLSGETGRYLDKLEGSRFQVEIYSAVVDFRPARGQSYRGYLVFDNSGLSGTAGSHAGVGFQGRFEFAERAFLDLHLQQYFYQNSNSADRATIDLRFGRRFADQSRITVAGGCSLYRNSPLADAVFLKAEYSLPFGIPVRAKKNVGRISGRVYDAETGRGLPRVPVLLNGYSVASDSQGRFRFPAVAPGSQYLYVDAAGLGAGRIPAKAGPVEVKVASGKESRLEVGVTRCASLSGRVTLYRFRRTDGSQAPVSAWVEGEEVELRESQGLANILVELSSGEEALRAFTGPDGGFEFPELRPGRWSLRVRDEQLPESHFLETESAVVALDPGESREVLLKVLPRKRTIQIIDEGIMLE